MIERLLENWLDSATERSLQVAFCQMLIDEGHTILHSSRHAPIEHGKDIITIDASDQPCAYQLKVIGGKKLRKSELSDILNQLTELVSVKIEHPSLDSNQWHRSFLVLNGELEEEASDLLTKWNAGWVQKGFPENQIKTIVRGELLDKMKHIAGRLFPAELVLFRLLLELYLEQGDGMLPKDKFARLIYGSLPMLNPQVEAAKPIDCIRAISSAALVNSIALYSFSKYDNFFAEIEAWILYLGHISAVADRFSLKDKQWRDSFEVIEQHIFNLLSRLLSHTMNNPVAIEGDPLTDQMFYRIRITLLCGLFGIHYLWRRLKRIEDDPDGHEDFCKDFIPQNRERSVLWGEAAIPQFLGMYWFLKGTDATPKPDFMIAGLLEAICKMNHPKSQQGLPNPYYDAESIVLAQSGLPEARIEDTFNEQTFTAEALMHLFVRRNWKNHTRLLWPNYTRLMCCTVEFDEPWLTYLWRNDDRGVNQSTWPKLTKNWQELKDEAFESEGKNIPAVLKRYPHIFLLFLVVYPHRCTSESVRWLDSQLAQYW